MYPFSLVFLSELDDAGVCHFLYGTLVDMWKIVSVLYKGMRSGDAYPDFLA